jgi:hypothetical protein
MIDFTIRVRRVSNEYADVDIEMARTTVSIGLCDHEELRELREHLVMVVFDICRLIGDEDLCESLWSSNMA